MKKGNKKISPAEWDIHHIEKPGEKKKKKRGKR